MRDFEWENFSLIDFGDAISKCELWETWIIRRLLISRRMCVCKIGFSCKIHERLLSNVSEVKAISAEIIIGFKPDVAFIYNILLLCKLYIIGSINMYTCVPCTS